MNKDHNGGQFGGPIGLSEGADFKRLPLNSNIGRYFALWRISFILGVLMYLVFSSFQPKKIVNISSSGYGSSVWIGILAAFGAYMIYIWLLSRKKNGSKASGKYSGLSFNGLMLILYLITFAMFIVIFGAFQSYTGKIWEWYLVQSGWFVYTHGYLIGIAAFFIVITLLFEIQGVINDADRVISERLSYMEAHAGSVKDDKDGAGLSGDKMLTMSIGLVYLYFAFEHIIFGTYGLFMILVFITAHLGLILLIFARYYRSSVAVPFGALFDRILKEYNADRIRLKEAKRLLKSRKESGQSDNGAGNGSSASTIESLARVIYYRVKLNWKLLMGLLAILGIILIPTVLRRSWDSSGTTVVLFLVAFAFMIYRDNRKLYAMRMRALKGVDSTDERADVNNGDTADETNSESNGRKRSLIGFIGREFGILLTGIFRAFRIVAVFMLYFTFTYCYEYPFYLTEFMPKLFLSASIGVLLFYLTRNNKKITALLYVILLGAMLALVFMINRDQLENAYSYYDGTQYLIWPFQVILSWKHAFIVGINIGFCMSYEIYRILFKISTRNDAADPADRSVMFIALMLLVVIQINLLGNYGLPGGKITSTSSYYLKDPPTLILNLLIERNFYAVIGAVILFIYFVFGDLLLTPYFDRRLRRRKIAQGKRFGEFSDRSSNNSGNNSENKALEKAANKTEENPAELRAEDFIDLPDKRAVEISSGRDRGFGMALPKKREVIAVALIALIILPMAFVTSAAMFRGSMTLPLLANDGNVSVFGAPSNVRIDCNQIILPEASSDSESLPLYEIKMAKNEFESFQLIFAPHDTALNGLTYSISGFKTADGADQIGSDAVSVRYADLIYDHMPEILKPFDKINLIERRNHVIWITIKTPYTMNAGDYYGTINFTYGNSHKLSVNIKIHVWNFAIPNRRHFRSNFGPQTYDLSHIQSFFNHRINSYGIPVMKAPTYEDFISDPRYTCWLNESSKTWLFNWTWWDNWTEYLLDHGQNGFYVNCPLGMPRRPIWVNNDDPDNISDWGLETALFYKELENHLTYLRDNEGKDWFPYVYIYFIDEFQMFVPDGYEPEQYWRLLEVFLALINSSAPHVKIMTTSPPSDELENLSKYIDIYCPISSDYDKERWEWAKSQGKEMWMYACVGPGAPWPNSHAYNRLFEIRVLYWQSWYYGLDGFLYWSTTPYYHGQYGWAFNGWGDAWYIHTDETGAKYDGIRWENFRDAAEDYEYLWLMNKTAAILGDSGALSDLSELVTAVTRDTDNYCDSGDIVLSNRNYIGDWLDQQIISGKISESELLNISERFWAP